jgi:hypothetical protein
MRNVIAAGLLLVWLMPASAWNDKGHMVSARIAWNKLSNNQQAKVIDILKKHPHYHEFLAAKKRDGFSEDEWVFMRAATWADWIRSHHTDQYHHGPWHYINYPFVPPGSNVNPADHEPGKGENIRCIARQCSASSFHRATGEATWT